MTALNCRFLCFSELGTNLLVQEQLASLDCHFGSVTLSHSLQWSQI